MLLFTYRCPKTRQLVQAYSAEDVSEDTHIYEFVRCALCEQIHRVGAILAGNDQQVTSRQGSRSN